jgi:hypothetical protein
MIWLTAACDTGIRDFLLGICGVIVGSVGQFVLDHFKYARETKSQKELDDARKMLLKDALDNPPAGTEWRKLQTLSRIIGANYETTTRLLIELKARGSELENERWQLLSKKPLRGTKPPEE